jgi:hypothetical protein
MLKWFDASHLSREDLKQIVADCGNLAAFMDDMLPECAEKTAGLRKLLEAKDCFVRAALDLPQE